MSAQTSQSDTALNGAEAMVRMLQAHQVEYVFGLCGDTTLPFYDALHRLDHGITHILSRDERAAAYMADGYARVSGRVGVCEGPSGGGATYILPGVVEANESSVAMVSITSDVSVISRGHYPLTELSQERLFAPLTQFNAVIDHPERLASLVRAAFRAATTGRPGAAHLGFPLDMQRAEVAPGDIWAQPEFGRFPAWPAGPDPSAVEKALGLLAGAARPLAICGGAVVSCGAEKSLAQLAERFNLAVATTVSGKGALADDHPLALGVIGSNGGTPATRTVVDAADLVIFIGCRAGSVTTERWRSPAPGVKVIQIDCDPMVISATYPTEVAMVSDVGLALAALNEVAQVEERQADGNGEQIVADARKHKFAEFELLSQNNGYPIRPERVVAALNALMPGDGIVVADPGTPCPYFSAYYQQTQPGRRMFSNRAHGALGYALAAAMGAQFAAPAQTVICAMGDGSFGMSVGELETLARLGLPVKCLVFSNSSFGWIKAGQRAGFGERYFSVDFSATDHAAVARAYGIQSWTADDPQTLSTTLAQALEAPGPALVDIISQPLEQAKAPVSEWIA